jgi:hypothetical protein
MNSAATKQSQQTAAKPPPKSHARNTMITPERLAEIEAAPREACLFKAEAKELADAYRERVPGLRVTKGADGAWLHIEAPSGKKAAISLEALGVQRAGLVGATLLEWVDAL